MRRANFQIFYLKDFYKICNFFERLRFRRPADGPAQQPAMDNFQSFQFKRISRTHALSETAKESPRGTPKNSACVRSRTAHSTFRAVPESGAMHRTAGKTHRAQPRKGEIGELALATVEQQVVERRFGEARSRKFAVGEPYAVETAPQQVGVRNRSCENHVENCEQNSTARSPRRDSP